jgi:predicted amino acid racemase
MSKPQLLIDPERIAANARAVVEIGRRHGIEIIGVTKGLAGYPAAARAMLAGGIPRLGDSRLENVARLRAAGVDAPITLLRSAAPSDLAEVVRLADASLLSDPEVMEALALEARLQRRTHGVTVMVDLHTGREGLPPERVPAACRKALALSGLRLDGLGAYFHMASGPDFHMDALRRLVEISGQAAAETGRPIGRLSGGSSNIFRTIAVEGRGNPGIGELRIGTAVLLGFASSIDPVTIPGLDRDTVLLRAQVIEVKADGSGEALLAIGKIETDPAFLWPVPPGIRVRDATSDHLMLRSDSPLRVGDWVSFRTGYPALCRLAASPYVQIVHTRIRV